MSFFWRSIEYSTRSPVKCDSTNRPKLIFTSRNLFAEKVLPDKYMCNIITLRTRDTKLYLTPINYTTENIT